MVFGLTGPKGCLHGFVIGQFRRLHDRFFSYLNDWISSTPPTDIKQTNRSLLSTNCHTPMKAFSVQNHENLNTLEWFQ